MKPTLLVLAAGMGSRYGGLKQMDGLGPHGETIIDYSIHDAVEAGFGKVVYIVRESFKADMEKAVQAKYAGVKTVDGEPLQFVFVTQELNKIPARFPLNPERVKPWGTAHAVLMAKDVIHEPFAVINGDDFYGKESFRILGDWCRAHADTTGQYCIVGFELDNTLSENGTVSRGICAYDSAGNLTDIAEHLEIGKEADGVVYGNNSVTGEKHVVLDAKALCSMNMWGFTPDYFAKSEAIFEQFLEVNANEPKKEYYIPFAVDCIVKSGQGACEVLSTPSPLHPVPLVRRDLQGGPPRRRRQVRLPREGRCLSQPPVLIWPLFPHARSRITTSIPATLGTCPVSRECSASSAGSCSAVCWAASSRLSWACSCPSRRSSTTG